MQATRYVCDFPGCGADAAWHMTPLGPFGGETTVSRDPVHSLQEALGGASALLHFDLCWGHAEDATRDRVTFAKAWKAVASCS